MKKNRVDKICEYCGKEFEVVKAREGKAHFCSMSCRSKFHMGKGKTARFWNGGPPRAKCEYCGKKFSGISGNPNRFCSTECHDRSRHNRIMVTCQSCGKSVEKKASHANRYPREFCSFKCYKTYAVRENSLKWRGGERGRKYYPKQWNKEFKQMIRERDNYKCAICGNPGSDVHHINYVKKDTTPENCITLCKSCHAKTNHNRSYWLRYFSVR